ncbi:unnamed protein product [Rhodiola kirilowii]
MKTTETDTINGGVLGALAGVATIYEIYCNLLHSAIKG